MSLSLWFELSMYPSHYCLPPSQLRQWDKFTKYVHNGKTISCVVLEMKNIVCWERSTIPPVSLHWSAPQATPRTVHVNNPAFSTTGFLMGVTGRRVGLPSGIYKGVKMRERCLEMCQSSRNCMGVDYNSVTSECVHHLIATACEPTISAPNFIHYEHREADCSKSHVCHPTTQPTNQPPNHPTNQPTNHPTKGGSCGDGLGSRGGGAESEYRSHTPPSYSG